MTDITERPKINPRRIANFGDDRPASTLVEVKWLVDPRMKVEIECHAYVDLLSVTRALIAQCHVCTLRTGALTR